MDQGNSLARGGGGTLTRRRFLQLGGGLAAGVALAPALARAVLAGQADPLALATAAPAGLPRELLDKVLQAALARGGDFADIYVEHSVRTRVQLAEGKIRELTYAILSGAGVRVVDGVRQGFAHSEVLDEPSLLAAARTASEIARSGKIVPPRPVKPWPIERVVTFAVPLEQAPEAAKIEILRRAEAGARAAGDKVREVSASWSDSRRFFQIASSQGFIKEDTLAAVSVGVEATAQDLGQTAVGQGRFAERVGWEVAGRLDAEALGEKAGRIAVQGLTAVDAPGGPSVVVVGSQGGVLLHEAVGHGLEADAVRKNSSYYTGRLGQKVGSEHVTLIDDPLMAGLNGSYNVDDEGVPGQRKVLIENGVLRGYLYDQVEALAAHRLSTGNGRRQGYDETPLPRMSNTFLKAGSADPADLFRTVGRGLYAASFGGGMVDTASGQFTFLVTEGYIIEDGKVGRPVRNASLVGVGSEVLQNIDLVASDLAFWPGTCGKGGQWVPVSAGCPTFRVKSIVVGGRG